MSDVLGFEYISGDGGHTLNIHTPYENAFLMKSIPDTFSGEPFRSDKNIRPGENFRVLASGDGGKPIRPLIGENMFGKGYCVYISFQSQDSEYDDLIKRAIFRAAGREKELFRLYSSNPAVQPYAYPDKNLFVLNNDTRKSQKTVFQLDTRIYPKLGKKIRIFNLIDNRIVGTYSSEQLAHGIEYTIDGGTAEYFIMK